jgi:hypothetical protein
MIGICLNVCMYVALITLQLTVCLCVSLPVRTLCLWSRSKSGNCGKNFVVFLLQRDFFFVLGVSTLKLLLLLLIIRMTFGCSTLVTSHVKEKVRTCDPS